MQVKNIALILTILLMHSSIYFAENLYSTISPIVTNQNFVSLANVSFKIFCSSEKDERSFERLAVVHSSKKICASDEAGRCNFDINQGIEGCFGCTASSSAIITATYYSQEINQTISAWDGYERVSPDERSCYASSYELYKRYYKEPSNHLESFVFTTYDLTIRAINENSNPIKDASITANSPDALYAKCLTDYNGECTIKNIPEGSRYNIRTSFNGTENETIVAVTDDISLEIRLNEKNGIVIPLLSPNPSSSNETSNTPDNCAGQCSGNEMCAYSPLNNNYGCCKLGEQWTGEKCIRQSSLKIFILPINYDQSSARFHDIKSKIDEMDKQLNLGYSSYYFVDRPLTVNPDYCEDNELKFDLLEKHFLSWYKQTRIFNQSLEPSKDKYRLLVIDFGDICNAGNTCGYTYRTSSFNPTSTIIYIRHDDSCKSPHVALHEFGHTFDLCDDYNPNVWERQNNYFTCPNPKPTTENSDCSLSCSNMGACCFGVKYGNGYYSTMGSANDVDMYNNTIKRTFGLESILHIQKKIEEVDAK
ncbi:MAG: hypothetical protein Q7S22_03300 [Candidatus Micrarchaeota archaeon]|nr:hypothetical protein [Candidatus Micrarchaeota archaeon]